MFAWVFKSMFCWIGEGNGNPLQCSCLENPRDGGAWWAVVYGVAQSWTRLKWLSSGCWTIIQFVFTNLCFHQHSYARYLLLPVQVHPLFSSLFCARGGWPGSMGPLALASGGAGLITEGLQGRSLPGGERGQFEVLLLLVLPVELLRAGCPWTPKVTVLIGEILCSAFSL